MEDSRVKLQATIINLSKIDHLFIFIDDNDSVSLNFSSCYHLLPPRSRFFQHTLPIRILVIDKDDTETFSGNWNIISSLSSSLALSLSFSLVLILFGTPISQKLIDFNS